MKIYRYELASLVLILIPIFFNMACSGDPDQMAKNSLEALVKKAVDRTNNDPGIVWQLTSIPTSLGYKNKYENLLNWLRWRANMPYEEASQADFKSFQHKWAKKLYSIKDVSFDVKKTNSLVSPYTGIITGLGTEVIVFPFNTKKEAEEVTKNPEYIYEAKYTKFKIEYSYKENNWKLDRGYIKKYEKWKELPVKYNTWDYNNYGDWRHYLGIPITPCGLVYKYWNP